MFKGLLGGFGPGSEDELPGRDSGNKDPEPGPAAAPGDAVQDPGPYKGGPRFDPSAIEAAAATVARLPRGRPGAVAARAEIAKLAEERRALKEKRQELAGYVKQVDGAVRQIAAEGRADIARLKAAQDQQKAHYRDQLARQREADALDFKRLAMEREAQRKEELARREDAIRRETLEYEAQLRQSTELKRVEAQTRGRILADRKNHDIRLEQLREDRKQSRQTLLEGISVAGETVGQGLVEFLGNRQEMVGSIAAVTAMALGIYAARTGTGVAGRYIEARLGKPSLVRETSRRTPLQWLTRPLHTAKRALTRSVGAGDGLQAAGDKPQAIFSEDLERRLRRIAQSTANTRVNRAPFRHLLLYGPPGTGKTLFAKGMAQASGLDYAILTGGDVAPLGREAVTEMHKVFDWASTSRRGVVLFVDEADAFLRRRSTEVMSEDMRNALNAFLYRTGEQSSNFMVVFATNQPEQFDDAINDRIDDLVPFHLPQLEERRRMLDFYMRKYILEARVNVRGGILSFLNPPAPIRVRGIEESHISAAARATEGFSGRELSKLAIAWQAAAFGSEDCTFTPELMQEILEHFTKQRAIKDTWDADSAADDFVSDHLGGGLAS
jgi:ATPase family AAA domain-containing protein 3A/B